MWVCQRYDLAPGEAVHELDLAPTSASLRYRKDVDPIDGRFAELYWEAAWFEGAASPLLTALQQAAQNSQDSRPVVVLASPADVEALVPSEEFLAARVLPGLIDRTAPLDAQYGSAKLRVRERTAWDFAEQLKTFPNRALIVLGAREESDLQRLFEVLEDTHGLQLSVVIVWPGEDVPHTPEIPNVNIEWWRGLESELVETLMTSGVPRATQVARWNIRISDKIIELQARDVRHVLQRFALITEFDVLPPRTFGIEDLQAFLRGDLNSWSAYGAGLPVPRQYRTDGGADLFEEIDNLLRSLYRGGDDGLTLTIQVPAKGGAGLSTMLRAAAHRAASQGFPTLVLRPEQVDIDLDQILAFSDALVEKSLHQGLEHLPPLLVVADVEHARIANLRQITQLLASRGRKVVVLKGVDNRDDEFVEKRTRRLITLAPLKASSDASEALACQQTFSQLATRWNLPLEVRSEPDWVQYESATRWHGGQESASLFWVTLRYFLVEGFTKGQRDSVEQAVGTWIDRRTDVVTDPSMKTLLDFTATLSSFRIAAPLWTVLRPVTGGSFSSAIVDSLRMTQDVLLWSPNVEEVGDQTLRFLHPAIAEHYLARRGVRDTIAKMSLLEPVIVALSSGQPADMWLAESIVTQVLVPDFLGRYQFDWAWRLDVFDKIPPLVRDQSKAILHHWARVLYLSADSLGSDPQDRAQRMMLAANKLRAAIKLPRRGSRDENPSHLYNTLGTALARYARMLENSNPAESLEAWNEARQAFQQAINLGGTGNVEALLAFSLRLIEHAEQTANSDKTVAASDMAYALDLVDEAEAGISEQATPDPEIEEQLVRYRARGMDWLQSGAGLDYIRQLQQSENSDLGYYCEARLHIQDFNDVQSLDRALDVLNTARTRGITLQPRSLRLSFSILRRHPQHRFDFVRQKDVLQNLESAAGSQMRLSDAFLHAVLCYQLELFVEGTERFRKLRELSSRTGNTPPRVREIWRDPRDPRRPRIAQLKVMRITGEWRGEAFVYDMAQRVPVRPRHFSPALKVNEVTDCVIRFEFFGPLAVPRRFEESGDPPVRP